MPIKKILLFAAFSLIILKQNLHAQTKEDIDLVTKSIRKIVMEYTDVEKIKDSTAIYSFAIKINVIREKNKQIVSVAINNPQAFVFFNGIDKFKELNYRPLMKNMKSTTFLFQSYITVYGSKYDLSRVKLTDFSSALQHLFPVNEVKLFYLGASLIQIDKKIYQ